MTADISHSMTRGLLALVIGGATVAGYTWLTWIMYWRFGLPRYRPAIAEVPVTLAATMISFGCGVVLLIAIDDGHGCCHRDNWPLLLFLIGAAAPCRYLMQWLSRKLHERDAWFYELVAQGATPEALAEAVARRRFAMDMPGKEISNFKVDVYDSSDWIKVHFSPEPPKGHVIFGGGVTYDVEKGANRIARVTFGR